MAVNGKKACRMAVISGKGGVGKTVITANMAAALASIGRRVLVLDADLGLANLDIVLGLAPEFTIQDALRGTQPLDKVIVPTFRGFDLLAAGSGAPEGALFTPAMADGVKSVLAELDSQYDAILFDAGAGVGDVVLFFADLANEILLVVTPEPTSIMDSYATIKILNRVYKRTEFHLIVNQANPRCPDQIGTAVAGHLQKVTSRFLEDRDQDTIRIQLIGSIPTDPAVPKAVMQRQLLSEASPQAPSTNRIAHLANYFRTRIACA
jgi:flagellar biosynthesis protein FlhG